MGNTQNNDKSQAQGNQNGEAGATETDEEIREEVIDELGLDPEQHEDVIDRAVEREKQHRDNLGKAIKQKIKYREQAKSQDNNNKDQSGQGDTQSGTNQGDTPDVEQLVEQKLEERQLESMNLPDKVKQEVKDLAQFKGISVEKAAKHDYIQNMKEEIERKERVKKATPKRKNKGSYTSKVDPSKPINPADYDMDTEEGVKAYQEAREARKKWKKNNS